MYRFSKIILFKHLLRSIKAHHLDIQSFP